VLELGGSGDQPWAERRLTVGVAVEAGEVAQALVPAGVWQRTVPSATDALVSCLVSPGFDFADFQLADGDLADG
jgi:predicted cupin superfamily sugar epimerase